MMTNTKLAVMIFSLVFSALIVEGCKEADDSLGYSIIGKIHEIPDDTKIFLYDLDQAINIDSAITKDGGITMSGVVDHPIPCRLENSEIGEYAYLIVENTKIEYESPLRDMYSKSNVLGGYEQTLSNRLKEMTMSNSKEYGLISDTLSAEQYNDVDHRNSLIARHRILIKKEKTLLDEFILSNPNSYFTLDLLYRNRERINRDTLIATLDRLKEEYRNTRDEINLRRFLEGDEVAKGDPFIDFEAPTLEGALMRLSSLKGNYIYLSFWDSGCRPCRKENKHFSRIYDSLPEDFKIVSVSVDRKKEHWRKASEMDGIKWMNVSNLKGLKGEIAMSYGVVTRPTSFLIGKDGIIIEKYKGFGDDSIDELLATIESKRKEVIKG